MSKITYNNNNSSLFSERKNIYSFILDQTSPSGKKPGLSLKNSMRFSQCLMGESLHEEVPDCITP